MLSLRVSATVKPNRESPVASPSHLIRVTGKVAISNKSIVQYASFLVESTSHWSNRRMDLLSVDLFDILSTLCNYNEFYFVNWLMAAI
jgi:hypothetical protein